MRRTRLVAALTLAAAVAAPTLAHADGRTFTSHRLCRFDDSRIDESSGIAASSTVPGAFWTHNDSGDTPRWFLVSGTTCATLATYALSAPPLPSVGGENAYSLDWEDMARGADASGHPTLLFGDIGDNQQARANKTVYEFTEPDGSIPTGDTAQTEQPVALLAMHTVVLPQAPVDSETLLFVPQTRQLGIVTKPRDLTTGLDYTGRSVLYVSQGALPSTTGPVPMTAAGNIDFTTLPRMNPTDTNSIAATAGDVSPDGKHLVVRAYYDAYEWEVPSYDLGAAISAAPQHIPLLTTKQGEGICYSLDGTALYTSTEGTGLDGNGNSGVIDRYDIASAAAPALPEMRWPALGLIAVLGLICAGDARRRAVARRL